MSIDRFIIALFCLIDNELKNYSGPRNLDRWTKSPLSAAVHTCQFLKLALGSCEKERA